MNAQFSCLRNVLKSYWLWTVFSGKLNKEKDEIDASSHLQHSGNVIPTMTHGSRYRLLSWQTTGILYEEGLKFNLPTFPLPRVRKNLCKIHVYYKMMSYKHAVVSAYGTVPNYVEYRNVQNTYYRFTKFSHKLTMESEKWKKRWMPGKYVHVQ